VYELFGNVDVGSTVWRVVFSYQEAILWGVILAFALDRPTSFDRVSQWFASRWALGAASAITAGILLLHRMETQSTWDAQILYVLMTVIVAAVVLRKKTPLLTHPWLVHVGKISYGIYLLHTFVIYAAKKIPALGDPWVCFLVSAPLSIALASVVYRCFEQPIITYYKRRFSPLKNPAGRTEAAAETMPPVTETPPLEATS
jgi:peptidoglycan/LPS O-acetylase OafA/YrhL